MSKKTKIIVYPVICIVLLGAGFLSGSISTGRKVDELGAANQKLTNQIEDYRGRVDELTGERNRLNSKIGSLANQIDRLNALISDITRIGTEFESGLTGIYNELGNSRQGIKEASEGLDGVSEEIRQAIEESEAQESDNNR